MDYKLCLNLFVLTATFILFIAYNKKQPKLTESPLEKSTFTFHVSRNPIADDLSHTSRHTALSYISCHCRLKVLVWISAVLALCLLGIGSMTKCTVSQSTTRHPHSRAKNQKEPKCKYALAEVKLSSD